MPHARPLALGVVLGLVLSYSAETPRVVARLSEVAGMFLHVTHMSGEP
jgi:hypothetical protein